jgi:hypothetical protein
MELLGIRFGAAVLRNPPEPGGKAVVAEHVDDRHLADDRTEQIWALHEAGAYQ